MQKRSVIAAGLGAAALVLPNVNAWAAASAKTKVITLRKSFTGTPGEAGQWGQVQVQIVVRKTTTLRGTHKKVAKRIVAVRVPLYPDHTGRSVFISEQALPILAQETLQAQSTQIDLVTGATYTSVGFDRSLQSAILHARSW